MRKFFFLSLLFFTQTVFAQFHLGVFLGTANYIGDLNDKPFKRTKGAVGVSLNYDVSNRFALRSDLVLGKVQGGDKYSGTNYLKQVRNLDFESAITEVNLLGEFTVFNLDNIRWSPYAFGGLAVYHFNPYTVDSGSKVYLQPLSTEGQGLPDNAARKPYALTQFAIPFGGGIKFNLTDNIRLGVELGMRRLFNDYLDDVSTTYTDPNLLLVAKGPKAVELSYRGDEAPGGSPVYPTKDLRGNSKTADWYYFTGVHLMFRLGGGYGKTFASGHRRGYGCPGNPM